MRRLVVFIFFVQIVGLLYSQDEQGISDTVKVNWEASYKKALQRAKKEYKPILIYFSGSDWCGPCIELDKKLFHTKKFVTYAEQNFILYMADFPRNKDLVTKEASQTNKRLGKKYNNSFPTMLLINSKEKVLGERKGSYMIDYYYTFFDEVLQKFYQ